MVIKASAAAEIRALVEALSRGDEVRREAAVARLAIIGERAVERLLAAYRAPDAERAARAAILRALEPIGDPRALPAAEDALAEGGDVALAAIGVLRRLLNAACAATSLELLLRTAFDRRAEHRVRIAAIDVLQTESAAVRQQIVKALADDPDPLVRTRVREKDGTATDDDALWEDVLGGRLPDDPQRVRELLAARASTAPLNRLQGLVECVREREAAASHDAARAAWRALRGTIHQALAVRGSRLALYDLRETLDAASGALPGTYLAALQRVGDRSLLEPIAAALSRAPAGDEPWRVQLAQAFRTIAKRERVTRRHAAVRRIAERWPAVAAELGLGGPRAARAPHDLSS